MKTRRVHRYCAAMLTAGCFVILSGAQEPQKQRMDEWQALEMSLKGAKSIHPKNGFVPDEATAIKIADAAAVAQYGESIISKERPFRTRLYGDTWIVKGTLHPPGALGGTAVIKVSKIDGRILFMTHEE